MSGGKERLFAGRKQGATLDSIGMVEVDGSTDRSRAILERLEITTRRTEAEVPRLSRGADQRRTGALESTGAGRNSQRKEGPPYRGIPREERGGGSIACSKTKSETCTSFSAEYRKTAPAGKPPTTRPLRETIDERDLIIKLIVD